MAKNDRIPLDYLRECFDLDVASGALIRRERPVEHFAAANDHKATNTRNAGKRADKLEPWGDYKRRRVRLAFQGENFTLRAHRVVFALVYGRWPENEIDHINGDATDNRPENLREATRSENLQNQRKALRNNKSGMLGIRPQRRRWTAKIQVNNRTINLGSYHTPEEARAAYLAAKARLHPFS